MYISSMISILLRIVLWIFWNTVEVMLVNLYGIGLYKILMTDEQTSSKKQTSD